MFEALMMTIPKEASKHDHPSPNLESYSLDLPTKFLHDCLLAYCYWFQLNIPLYAYREEILQ